MGVSLGILLLSGKYQAIYSHLYHSERFSFFVRDRRGCEVLAEVRAV